MCRLHNEFHTLSEFSSTRVPLLERETVRLISDRFGKYINVVRDLFDDSYVLEAKHYIGAFSVSGRQFRIDPKIPVKSLYFIISRVYDLTRIHLDEELIEQDSYVHLLEHLLQILLLRTECVLRQGLYSQYIDFSENQNFIRGKLVMKSLTQCYWDLNQIECLYHEYSPDVLENQLILKALKNASLIPFLQITKARIRGVINKLWAVSEIDLLGRDVDKVVWNRLNSRYKNLLAICRFFLDNSGLREEVGDYLVQGFFIDMNKLFENYVCRILSEKPQDKDGALPDEIEIKTQYRCLFAEQQEITLIPDVVLLEEGKPRLVLDVKYKKSNTPSAEDIYQMNAYSDHFDTDVALVYPTADIPNREYCLPNGHKIYLAQMDLAKSALEEEEVNLRKTIRIYLNSQNHITGRV